MSVPKEVQIKTERLLRLMSKAGHGGILINSQPNFSWLTAGGRNGTDLSREAGVGTLAEQVKPSLLQPAKPFSCRTCPAGRGAHKCAI